MSKNLKSIFKNISIGFGLHLIVFMVIGYIIAPPWQTNADYYYAYGLIIFVLPTLLVLFATNVFMGLKRVDDQLTRKISIALGIVPLPFWMVVVAILKRW